MRDNDDECGRKLYARVGHLLYIYIVLFYLCGMKLSSYLHVTEWHRVG